MRMLALSVLSALSLLTLAPALAATHAGPATTVGEAVGNKDAVWSAEDASQAGPGAAATPVQPRRGARSDVAPASTPASSEPRAEVATDPEAQKSEVQLAANEAFAEVVRAKLAAADAVAARAASPEVQRIALGEFQLLLQRATCAAVHGDLASGEGAECIARPAVASDGEHDDDEEVQLCAEQGGVLVKRMDSCTEASCALASLHVDEGASVGLEALVGAFADVARQCWGRTLCVE